MNLKRLGGFGVQFQWLLLLVAQSSLLCKVSAFGYGGELMEISQSTLQSLLPPSPFWNDTKSVQDFVWKEDDDNEQDQSMMTPAEASDFQETATYEQVTEFFARLAADHPEHVKVESIATLANGEDMWLVKVVSGSSSDGDDEDEQKNKPEAAAAEKPIIFATAGIHAGESSGVNAGMMFVRNLVKKETYKSSRLLDSVNFYFVPIMNVQGYLRQSTDGRINQHGPNTSGRRANGSWQNLNRDFSKLDTPEVQAVVGVMRDYNVSFYTDMHSTDGMNYQSDVTWCDNGDSGLSSAIYKWLRAEMQPDLERFLQDEYNHKTSGCYYANNAMDPTKGYDPYYSYGATYSTNYADHRHIPAYLLEIHSLKPNKQRVLGAYAFLLGLCKIISNKGDTLQQAIREDRAARVDPVPIAWTVVTPAPMVEWPIFEYEIVRNPVLGINQIQWTDVPLTITVEQSTRSVPLNPPPRPYAYLIPAVWKHVIRILALHGIEMEVFTNDDDEQPISLDNVVRYRTENATFNRLFEGHAEIKGGNGNITRVENCTVDYRKNDVMLKTDQPLGTLAVALLEPSGESSLFLWGFFSSMLTSHEFPENYIMIPLAEKMLNESAALAAEWDLYKTENPAFVNDTSGTLAWFFRRSAFYDPEAYMYPVGMLHQEPDIVLPLKPFTTTDAGAGATDGSVCDDSSWAVRNKAVLFGVVIVPTTLVAMIIDIGVLDLGLLFF